MGWEPVGLEQGAQPWPQILSDEDLQAQAPQTYKQWKGRHNDLLMTRFLWVGAGLQPELCSMEPGV